jgi:hypothetical protein
MWLLVICNYIWIFLQLYFVLSIFATTLQLIWCSYFHVNNISFGFHPSRKIYLICFGFHFHLEKYINKVFCLYNFIFKNMDKWESQWKWLNPK